MEHSNGWNDTCDLGLPSLRVREDLPSAVTFKSITPTGQWEGGCCGTWGDKIAPGGGNSEGGDSDLGMPWEGLRHTQRSQRLHWQGEGMQLCEIWQSSNTISSYWMLPEGFKTAFCHNLIYSLKTTTTHTHTGYCLFINLGCGQVTRLLCEFTWKMAWTQVVALGMETMPLTSQV